MRFSIVRASLSHTDVRSEQPSAPTDSVTSKDWSELLEIVACRGHEEYFHAFVRPELSVIALPLRVVDVSRPQDPAFDDQ